MNAKLPNELREAIAQHPDEPLRVDDEATKTPYVLLRLDLFEQMKKRIGNGDSADHPVDEERLKAAIEARRDESRQLNEDWEVADREVWETHNT